MKRKTISKELRQIVYKKYNGHCAYCGDKIEYKDMQVDHFAPVRNFGDNIEISNLMPACRSCNGYKDTYTISKFREQLSKIPSRLMRDVTTYKIALRYGLIKETNIGIKFYYEEVKERLAKLESLPKQLWSMEDIMWFENYQKEVEEVNGYFTRSESES
jgi:hypothetical protein